MSVTPLGFTHPPMVVIPGRRRISTQPPIRGGNQFGAGDQISFKLVIDTSQAEYLDLFSLRFRCKEMWAKYDSLPQEPEALVTRRETALVDGGPQNMITRVQLVLNDSLDMLPDLDDYARFFNLIWSKAVDQYARQEMEYSCFHNPDDDDVQAWRRDLINPALWGGRDIFNDPIRSNTGSVPIILGFNPTSRYMPVRMAAGAMAELILTLAPDSDVILPKIRRDDDAVHVEQPHYYVRQPELTCEIVRANQLTQAELAQMTAVQGGIALNYTHAKLVRQQAPASSTEDWILVNSLSKSLAGWVGYCRPILETSKPYFSDSPMAPKLAVPNSGVPSFDNTASSGWDYEKRKFLEFYPLPLAGAGELQTQIGDIKYPPRPRDWKARMYDNRTWDTTAPSFYDYPQTTVQSYAGVLDEFVASLTTLAVMETERPVFDSVPLWPRPDQARWNPYKSSVSGETNMNKTVKLANSKAKSSGSNRYPHQSQWTMSEYLSALRPSESRTTQSGVDVDRVGNHMQIRVKRANLSQQIFPQAFTNVVAACPYAASGAVTSVTAAVSMTYNGVNAYMYTTPGNTSRPQPFYYDFTLAVGAHTTMTVNSVTGALDGAYLQISSAAGTYARIMRSVWTGTQFTVKLMAPFQPSVVSTWTAFEKISFQRMSGYHWGTLLSHILVDGQQEACVAVTVASTLATANQKRELLGKWFCVSPTNAGERDAISWMGKIVDIDSSSLSETGVTSGVPISTYSTPVGGVSTLVIENGDINGGVIGTWSAACAENELAGKRVYVVQAGASWVGTILTNSVITTGTLSSATLTLTVRWDVLNGPTVGGTFAIAAGEPFIHIYRGPPSTTQLQLTLRGTRYFDWRQAPSRSQTSSGLFNLGNAPYWWVTDDYQTVNDVTNDHLDFTGSTARQMPNPIAYLQYYVWLLENRSIFWSNDGRIAVSH